jgi:outer membrane autotransporter protein
MRVPERRSPLQPLAGAAGPCPARWPRALLGPALLLLLAASAGAQPITTQGSTAFQQRTGDFVLATCAPLVGIYSGDTLDLQQRCTELVFNTGSLSSKEFDDALQQVGHEELAAIGVASTRTAIAQLETLEARLHALREGGPAIQIAGLSFRDAEGRPVSAQDLQSLIGNFSGASDDAAAPWWGRFGAFLNGVGSWGDYDGSSEEAGFDFDSGGFVAGVDYRLTDQIIAGIAGGWSVTDADFDDSAGELERDRGSVSLYGSWQPGDWWLDGAATWSSLDYDLERNIEYASAIPPVRRTARGDVDGDQWAFSAGTGYGFHEGSWSFGPHLRFSYVRLKTDSFRESGAGGLALEYQSERVRSATTALGGDLSYALSTSFGVLTPYLRAEWVHEFENDARTIRADLPADPLDSSTNFIRTRSPDRDWADLGAGVAATLPHGFTAFLDFDTLLGVRDVEVYVLTLGGRYEF